MTVAGGVRTIAVLALLVSTAGCFGGSDTEARTAAESLADALSEPDAAALRDLVRADSSVVLDDLLTDEVVAANAFAGEEIDVAADLDRYNGYGTFTLTSPDVPDGEVSVQMRLTETRTPGALATVAVTSDRPLTAVLIGDQRIELDAPAEDATGALRFSLPPGTWTLGLPANPYVTSAPQRVEVVDSRPIDDVALRGEINAAGRAEAIRRADAYVAACERPTKKPTAGCGGDTTLCIGDDTTRRMTFSPEPVWTVDTARGPALTHQPGLRRTVSTTCTDRETGEVTERTEASGDADLGGAVVFTEDGLDVDLR